MSMIPLDLKDTVTYPLIPWQLSQQVQGRLKNESSVILLQSDPEFSLVSNYFNADKPPGYSIAKITAVYNNILKNSFINHLCHIELEAKKFPPSWDKEDLADERMQTVQRWRMLTKIFPLIEFTIDGQKKSLSLAKVVPVWHGTSLEKAISICESGFTYFGKHAFFKNGNDANSTDIGYFGSGIYSTDSAKYASLYSKGYLLLSWMGSREPFPVVSNVPHPGKAADMCNLIGKGAYKNYDLHFVPVACIRPQDSQCMEYYPCYKDQSPAWDEFVAFQKAQLLPAFIIELQPDFVKTCDDYSEYDFSLCYAACKAGNISQVETWIIENPNRLIDENNQGENLLYAAVLGNQPHILHWLYEENPSLLKKRRKDNWSLMHVAAAEGHLLIIRWLHAKDPLMVKSATNTQLTPLHVACFCEQIKILLFFVKPILTDYSLIELIVQRPCLKALTFLLAKGLSIKYANHAKQTLLHLAAEKGLEENVQCLLENGADINAKDLSHKTPLWLAVVRGHRSVVNLLLTKGAEMVICTTGKESILHTAAFYGHSPILEKILTYPEGRQLCIIPDDDGKLPIHRAVWGPSSPDIVALLLKVNHESALEKNKYGYTPLHWAAKHGHLQSAELLLNAKASWHEINVNGETPIDLAIKFEQNDILYFILKATKKLPEEEISKDVEGYYYKRLITAKKQEMIEEQIIHLTKLGIYYYTEKKDHIQSAKILNGALHLVISCRSGSPFEKFLFMKLAQIEESYFAKYQMPGYKGTEQRIRHYRIELQKLRGEAKKMLELSIPVKEIQFNLTERFKRILSSHIQDIQKIVGAPSVEWSCIGMGSMARGEMCPNSDIEFAFLIEKDNPQDIENLRNISYILQLQIINLGETKFPIFDRVDNTRPSPTPNGFSLDSAGNSPLGVSGVYELIGTPKKIAGFQSITWINRNIILPNALSAVCVVAGSKNGKEKLALLYTDEVKKEMKKKEKTETIRNVLAFTLLEVHLQEFRPNLSKEKEEIGAFGIKKELYRPFQEIIGCLALFFELKATNTISRLDELEKLKVISTEGVKNLKAAFEKVLNLRVKAHLFYGDEVEYLFHLEEEKIQDSNLLYLESKLLNLLEEIFKTLIPFHQCAEKFYKTRNKLAFKNSSFYDDSPLVQGRLFEKTLQFTKAKQAYQNAISLNPNDISALMLLGQIEDRMGKNTNSLSRNLKALELAKKNFKESPETVAVSYNSLGHTYKSLAKMLKHYLVMRKQCKSGLKLDQTIILILLCAMIILDLPIIKLVFMKKQFNPIRSL